MNERDFRAKRLGRGNTTAVFRFPPARAGVVTIGVGDYANTYSLLGVRTFSVPTSSGAHFVGLRGSGNSFYCSCVIGGSNERGFSICACPTISSSSFSISYSGRNIIYATRGKILSIGYPINRITRVGVASGIGPFTCSYMALHGPSSERHSVVTCGRGTRRGVPSFSVR